MRCLALAHVLRRQGHQVTFACRQHPGNLIPTVEAAGFTVLTLPATCDGQPNLPGYLAWLGCSQEADAGATLALLEQDIDWLIVDHYALDDSWERRMRSRCRFILAIDDLANRNHDADLLLDQNALPNADTRYSGRVPTHCTQLIGPGYALLRDEFFTPPPPHLTRHGVLVSFGGADTHDLTGLTVRTLSQAFPTLKADIVVTANYGPLADLRHWCAQHPPLTLHVQCDYMAQLMHHNQIMIGAGGAMHWERCVCALPALVVTLAENQRATTRFLAEAGACVWLGDGAVLNSTKLSTALQQLLSAPQQLAEMATRCKSWVPRADGAHRIAALMTQQFQLTDNA